MTNIYDLEVAKARTKQLAIKAKYDQEVADANRKQQDKFLGKGTFGERTRRSEATLEGVRTSMTFWRFLKPLIIFFLMIILFLGLGFSALQNIILAIGWWWLAFLGLGILFFKNR